MIYALISQNIISGNGISLPIMYSLKDNYDFMNGTVPYVGGPPLLPILFALLGGVTPHNYFAAQIINVISHVAIAIFTFLLMEKLYDNKGFALLTGILVSLSLPLLWDAHHMITESLYISLAVAALFFLTLSRYADTNHPARNLFIASICISAAILTRYAGVALMPVFFWGIFVLVKNKRIKLTHASTFLAAMLPFMTTGALFMRTYMISGSLHGIPLPSPERTFLSALTGTIEMIPLQFDLGPRLVQFTGVIAILFILYFMLSSNARRALAKYIHSGLDLIIAFIISHTAIITYAMFKSQTVFELRYMSPLTPFLFILFIIMIGVISDMIKMKGFAMLSVYGLVLSLGIITFGSCYKTYANADAIFSKRTGHYRILSSPTYIWLKENYSKDVKITTNRPFHRSFFGGYSTIRLPHRRFNKNYRIPDNMESYLPDRMSHFGSRVLALFEDMDDQDEGRYLSKLFNKRGDDDNFTLTQKFSDGVIYTLKK